MSVRWHVVAWVGLLSGLAVWMWPLDPNMSLMDLATIGPPFTSDPGNTLDALFADGPLEGTALLRLWIGGVLVGGAVAIEIVRSRRRRRQRRDELPRAPSEAQFGYSD